MASVPVVTGKGNIEQSAGGIKNLSKKLFKQKS